ncbi:hypothetical protein M1N58_02710 [Dehalococcoidales bacterium]|nr:hypothetical protein [Dehalococcoidales bacterium]
MLRWLLEIDEETLGFIQDEIYLGIDEHSFRHQELVQTEVKKRRVLGILRMKEVPEQDPAR